MVCCWCRPPEGYIGVHSCSYYFPTRARILIRLSYRCFALRHSGPCCPTIEIGRRIRPEDDIRPN